MRRWLLMAAVLGILGTHPAGAEEEPVRLLAAGNLRAALTDLAGAFRAAPGGAAVAAEFGPSGVLRQRIEGGDPAEVFASADLGHPRALAQARGRVIPAA